DIPSKIKYDGITYEVLRPEQLGCDSKDIPLFGERRSKARAAKHKKNQRRRPEETEWENKRKSTIEERLFNRAFAGYSESDLMVTGDGLLLPRLPSWLNSTRETQHDGSPGVFICSPSKEDFNSRFLEILEALEPIGVEIGVAKIRVPDGWYIDEMGIPQVFSMDQRLPLHPESSSSIAPIYHVTSTPKTLVSGTDWLKDINLQLERERRIAARDPSIQVYGSLQEETMVARGRDWREILTGDKGGVSKYSSDNDATEALRSYLGLKDPRLTELPGNIVHDSKHKVTGIHTPYLYIGQAYTLFALHAEDYNAFSLNYQHLGAPKTWRVVCPRDFYLVEGFVDGVLHPSSSSGKEPAKCSQFVRHASLFLPKETLETAGARSIQFSQNPGELVVTWPLAYHQGWNEGVNVNEACGYGHKGWRKVFGSGEDDQSEHKVYRPCGSRCIGDNAPIILSF
ncbi:JmjC-domain-containing protein, partial [Morchella conica CCBAS932]